MFVLIVIACALLNRVRGGGFGGQYLPGRSVLWVAPLVGALAYGVAPWPVALAVGAGYLFWGLFSWGYLLSAIGGAAPNRSPTALEALLMRLPGTALPVFVRMLFVLPGVGAITWLVSAPVFLLAAPLFAAASTAVCIALFRPIKSQDWQRAEVAIGALWGLLILSLKAVT